MRNFSFFFLTLQSKQKDARRSLDVWLKSKRAPLGPIAEIQTRTLIFFGIHERPPPLLPPHYRGFLSCLETITIFMNCSLKEVELELIVH